MTTMMATRKYQFTSEVDKRLVCSVCLEVAEDPKQEVNCGQLFCRSVLRRLKTPSVHSVGQATQTILRTKKVSNIIKYKV